MDSVSIRELFLNFLMIIITIGLLKCNQTFEKSHGSEINVPIDTLT